MSFIKKSKQIIFIVGPTAVGKTAVALALAKKINGEIVSCDSMQVYKEASIASNKPSSEDLKKISHHLINIISVAEDFDVGNFQKKASAAIQAIHARGKIPIVVGGSGMYMSVLLDGIFKDGRKDLNLRKTLEIQAKQEGSESLYQKLLKADPDAAQKIHSNDAKRIIRALEVFLLKSQPISVLQKTRQGLWGKFDIKIFALNRSREELYELINRRVEEMFRRGLVEEIKRLLAMTLNQSATQIIGIKEVKGFLDGQYDLERAKYLLKLHTRHYAKRQLTWFRKDKRLQWMIVPSNETPRQAAERILEEIGQIRG